ncbi:hypothetical protein M422DRAFT_246821 [Sphaerobolus stellatus SS14]|nr:hypothetical protein M422DRAFT_246821 [Sphaerobolus stellatus SS14]
MLRIEDVLAVPSGEGACVGDGSRCIGHLGSIHRFAVEGAFVFTSHADFRAATRNFLFQPAAANATANYSPPPSSQPRIFVPAVPVIVGRQVYNYHAIYESILEGMEVEIRWWRAVDLREIGMDVRLVISLVKQMPQRPYNTPGASRKRWAEWLMRWRRWGGGVLCREGLSGVVAAEGNRIGCDANESVWLVTWEWTGAGTHAVGSDWGIVGWDRTGERTKTSAVLPGVVI